MSQERFEEVESQINTLRAEWLPEPTNIKSLYLRNGNEWKKTPIHQSVELSKEQSYADMPSVLVDYLKSLPEYDGEVFTKITGKP